MPSDVVGFKNSASINVYLIGIEHGYFNVVHLQGSGPHGWVALQQAPDEVLG